MTNMDPLPLPPEIPPLPGSGSCSGPVSGGDTGITTFQRGESFFGGQNKASSRSSLHVFDRSGDVFAVVFVKLYRKSHLRSGEIPLSTSPNALGEVLPFWLDGHWWCPLSRTLEKTRFFQHPLRIGRATTSQAKRGAKAPASNLQSCLRTHRLAVFVFLFEPWADDQCITVDATLI